MGRFSRSAVLLVAATAVAVVIGGPARADEASDTDERAPVAVPVVWSIIAELIVPVEGTDEQIHLVYELLVTNVTSRDVQIHAIEVVDPDQDDEVVGVDHVLAIEGEDVTGEVRLLSLPITMDKANYATVVPPGQTGVVYIDVTLADRRDVPNRIAHRVTVSLPDTPEVTGVGAIAEISRDPAVVIRPPLHGDRWVVGDGCCTIIGPHRYTLLPLGGKERAAQHFAIDFVQLDEEGRLFTGNREVLENWHYYGADIVAAAAGEVVKVVDDLPDQVPGQLPAGITLAEADGNHVIVDIGQGRFMLYAHMIPGSIVVEPGQRVRAGQLLGHLGNSGNSDGPHLHFQVMDVPSLETVGLPFVFDRMELQGHLVGSLAELEAILFSPDQEAPEIDFTETGVRHRQMPLTSDLLGF